MIFLDRYNSGLAHSRAYKWREIFRLFLWYFSCRRKLLSYIEIPGQANGIKIYTIFCPWSCYERYTFKLVTIWPLGCLLFPSESLYVLFLRLNLMYSSLSKISKSLDKQFFVLQSLIYLNLFFPPKDESKIGQSLTFALQWVWGIMA